MKAKIFKVCSREDKGVLHSFISSLPDDLELEVVVRKKPKKRSLPQNNLLHLWMKCIEDDTGTHRDEVKEFVKIEFLGYEEVDIFGTTHKRLRGTSKLNKEQMTDFLNKVQAWASSELGIVLPTPDDLYFTHFFEEYNNK